MPIYLFITPSPVQIIVVLVLGVLFFGKNLPDVAKRIGMSMLEFRKGLNEISEAAKDVASSNGFENRGNKSEAEERESDTERYDVLGTKFDPP